SLRTLSRLLGAPLRRLVRSLAQHTAASPAGAKAAVYPISEASRYQSIFNSAGIALCVFDLRDLVDYLHQHELHDVDRLAAWLEEDAEHHQVLSRLLRLTEANRIALDLLGVEDVEQAWRCLVSELPIQSVGNRFKL